MTDRKDLKRLVRSRQERTGESYVTALRQVLAQRSQIPVVELLDLTDAGAQLGMKCSISVFPALADRVDLKVMLEKFRDHLLTGRPDGPLAMMRGSVLAGEGTNFPLGLRTVRDGADFVARVRAGAGGVGRIFVDRAQAGAGEVSESGRILALEVEGKRGVETVLFMLQPGGRPSLVVTSPDAASVDQLLGLANLLKEKRRRIRDEPP